MPTIEITPAELRYLARMNAEGLAVMATMIKKTGAKLPDLALAEQLNAKFAALLPEGIPNLFAALAPAHPRRQESKQRTGTFRRK